MKINTSIILTSLLTAMIFVSCSKCYDCTQEIEIESGGTIITETSDPKEYCTVTGDEITALENDGYTCTPN